MDDVLSLNTSKLGDFVDRIHQIVLQIKDTTTTDKHASCLDLHVPPVEQGLPTSCLDLQVPLVE